MAPHSLNLFRLKLTLVAAARVGLRDSILLEALTRRALSLVSIRGMGAVLTTFCAAYATESPCDSASHNRWGRHVTREARHGIAQNTHVIVVFNLKDFLLFLIKIKPWKTWMAMKENV